MSITRIATANQFHSVLLDITRAQGREVEAQQQVSTGKTGSDLAGFADKTRSIVATQSVKARVDGLVDQLTATKVKLQTQQLGLESVSDSAEGLRQAIASALASDRADGLMTNVQAYFSSTVQALNTQDSNGYVFSGGQTATQPVNVTTLAQLGAASPIGSIFQNGKLITSARTDDSSTVQTGFLADTIGQPLMSSFQSIQQFNAGSSGPFSGQLTDAQRTFLQTTYTNLAAVTTAAVDVAAQGGNVQSRVDTALTSQTARQTTLGNTMGDLTGVDVAEAVSKLTLAQTAVQAAAQVFLSLKSMSLLNYLGGSTTTG
jgi:flagellar hook-associated protein 3 FlgL